MKFLTVAAAIFASTSLAVPTNNHNGGGACVPRPGPGNSNTSSAPGGNPTGGHTSSGPGTKPTGGDTSSGPGIKPTSSHTNSVPVTTSTGSNTGSHTSSGPSTTSTGHPGSGGEFRCPAGLYSNAQCCSTDILGVVGLDCSPPGAFTTGETFKSNCAASGKQAKCCVLPVAGQDVLCQDAISGGPVSSGNGGDPPGGHLTSVPGGHPTSVPGGHPTSVPGGHPTHVPGSNNPFSCPQGLYSNAQCCSTDILGVADLDCSPPGAFTTGETFKSNCAATGKQARCCVLPVAYQAVLCIEAY